MWPSLTVGNPNATIDMGHDVLTAIASNLLAHPHVDENIAKSIASQTVIFEETDAPQIHYAPFSPTGDGWFEDKIGKSANQVIRDLRKARRVFKEDKSEIDHLIATIRTLKSTEVEATLAGVHRMGTARVESIDEDAVLNRSGVTTGEIQQIAA